MFNRRNLFKFGLSSAAALSLAEMIPSNAWADPSAPKPSPTPDYFDPTPYAQVSKEADLVISSMFRNTAMVLKGQANRNTVNSPSTLETSAAIMVLGSSGQTRSELVNAMNWNGINDINGTMSAIINQLSRWYGNLARIVPNQPQVTPIFRTSSVPFISNAFQIKPTFSNDLTRFYNTTVKPFSNNEITNWISSNTKSQPVVPASYPDNTQAVMISTSYLAASFRTPFSLKNTYTGSFFNGANVSKIAFIQDVVPSKIISDAKYQAVELQFGSTLVIQIVLPTTTIESILDQVTLQTIAHDFAFTPSALNNVTIPKWSVFTTTEDSVLAQYLGAKTAFSNNADFSNISTTPLHFSSLRSDSWIAMSERGINNSPVTNLPGLNGTVVPVTKTTPFININRPFYFQILDTDHGVPLFTGQIFNP